MKPELLINKSKAFLHLHSSTILTCIGAVGVVSTAFMAAKATPKAIRILEEAKWEKGGELTKFETFNVVAPVYIPSFIMGATTIVCIFGANALNKQKQAALTSAYAILNNYHKEYRNKLIELHGKETDEQIRNDMAREHCNYHVQNSDIPDGKAIFYEEISGESIARYEREIMDAEYHINRNFAQRGYASLNEFYELLGLPKTDYGEELGWSLTEGFYWIDFEHRLMSRDDGGMEVYTIDMITPPEPDYMSDWT